MKKTLLFIFLLSLLYPLKNFGQTISIANKKANQAMTLSRVSNLRLRPVNQDVAPGIPLFNPAVLPSTRKTFKAVNTVNETVLGQTYYDLQTNNSVCNRLVNNS